MLAKSGDAVIRSYQPSRIERELLAQVYDIAQRGIQDHSACVGECPTVVDHSTHQAHQEGIRETCFTIGADRRH